ncbi:MAG TPA: tetratricopeptide repeat protein [bacterium]|nr:tetratricopeptide repeat protein [bacterium]HQG44382.1 tetratricopeptide repeat protein [bacterium]HQI47285.1 tetratricopeptide repeat protein [bacterium]HQJ63772.1 tetratricopeptide repeat protein [bacterium]
MRPIRMTIALTAGLFLLVCCACSGGRKKEQEVEAFLHNSASYYIKKGTDAITAGHYQEAVPLFRQAIALTPYDPVAQNDLGVAFYHLHQLDSALAYYQTAIRLRPDYTRAISNLSKTYSELGQKNYALAAAERLIELEPQSAAGYLLQAEIYDKNDQYDLAIEASRKALAADSSLKEVWNNLGVLYFRSGRLDQALECYQRVLAKDSTYSSAWFNLGNVLARKCLLEEAQFNYRKALEYNPQMSSAANNHGLVYLYQDRLVEADRDFHRALAADSSAPAIYYNLSIVQERLDSLQLALASIDRAIQLRPAIANFYLQRGTVLERLGQKEAAVAAIERAVTLDSTLSAGYNTLGNLMAADNPAGARAAYEKAVANYDEYLQRRYGRATQVIDKGYFDLLAACKDRRQLLTDHAMVFNNLGKSWLQAGNYPEAGKAFAKAVELQPELWEPAENLAVVLIAQKKNEEARKLLAQGRLNRARAALRADSLDAAASLLHQALRLQPRLRGSYGLLAQVQERKGQIKEAEATLRTGLKLYPAEAALHLACGRFLYHQGRLAEARTALTTAVTLDPKQDESRYLLAGIYRTLGETEKADREIARSHAILGQGYEEAGFLDRAMEEYHLAAAADPREMEYPARQGVIFLKKRLYEDAARCFDLALASDKANVTAMYGKGTLLGELKSHEEAVRWLQAAIAAAPDHGLAHQALAVNYYFLGRLDAARQEAQAAQKLGIALNEAFLKALGLPALTPR